MDVDHRCHGIRLVFPCYFLLKALAVIREEKKRRTAEEALKQSEEKYRELVENVNSIIFRRDAAGVITFINEFAQKFFDYDEKELLGRNVVGPSFRKQNRPAAI